MLPIIEGEQFLVFGDEWGAYPTTTEHVLRRFVSCNEFLWVHLMGMRHPQLNRYDVARVWQRLSRRPRNTTSTVHTNRVCCYSPLLLPLGPLSAARRWNRRVVVDGVRTRLQQAGAQHPIVITSVPTAAELLGCFDEKLVAYICEDEYAEMPGVYRNYVREMEQRLLERADLVFATSSTLAERKSMNGKRAVYLPQGVDADHFGRYSHRSEPVPSDLARIPPPWIGFMGLLADWVDIDLLVEVACANRAASVVIIGPSRTDVRRLSNLPNVYLLGPRLYEILPQYVVHFDVGLIPFRRNLLTQHVNPLKLLEYYAAGVPVVSTPLPDITQYAPGVRVATNTREFLSLVTEALTRGSDSDRQRRIEIARANSWQSRAEVLSRHMEVLLNRACGRATTL